MLPGSVAVFWTYAQEKPNQAKEKNTMKNTMIMMFFAAVLAIFTTSANAAIQVNESTQITLQVFVPCAAGGAGEIVDLSGPLHVLITFTINGNNVSGRFQFQPQGISGTGETTGLNYQATGLTAQSFAQSLVNGQATLTFINRFDIIGQGPNNNFTVHETFHFTFNADGTVTVLFDDFSVECR
jgi:hypothetical protein